MNISSATQILVVDDDNFHRKGVSIYLRQKGFDVLEAADGETAWQTVSGRKLDAVILDIVLPPAPNQKPQPRQSIGVELARRIKRIYPSLGIVLFSAREDRGRAVMDLIRDGVRGVAYKLKGCSPADLLAAIEAVRAGQVLIDPEITSPPSLADDLLNHLSTKERRWVEQTVTALAQLTPRERDVAERIAASHNIKGIAQALNITAKTVDNHISRVYQKLGLNDMRQEAPSLRRSAVLTKACLIHDLRAGGEG